jgi:lipoprotein-anchoring transpeptidase ErfK/SrfK
VSFVQRYGWRAYAVPLLSVVTLAALVRGTAPAASAHTPEAHNAAAHSSAKTPSRGSVKVEGLTATDAGFDAGSTPTPTPVVVNLGDDAASCATNSYQQLVVVSLRQQHLWACEGGKQVNSTPVTTGATAHNDQTPLGSWRVQAKQRDRYLVGPGYRDYVHYWVPFNGDFGLHDAPWQTMPLGSQNYRQQGSNGCVHLPTATMAWLYRWASVGHTVVTIES